MGLRSWTSPALKRRRRAEGPPHPDRCTRWRRARQAGRVMDMCRIGIRSSRGSCGERYPGASPWSVPWRRGRAGRRRTPCTRTAAWVRRGGGGGSACGARARGPLVERYRRRTRASMGDAACTPSYRVAQHVGATRRVHRLRRARWRWRRMAPCQSEARADLGALIVAPALVSARLVRRRRVAAARAAALLRADRRRRPAAASPDRLPPRAAAVHAPRRGPSAPPAAGAQGRRGPVTRIRTVDASGCRPDAGATVVVAQSRRRRARPVRAGRAAGGSGWTTKARKSEAEIEGRISPRGELAAERRSRCRRRGIKGFGGRRRADLVVRAGDAPATPTAAPAAPAERGAAGCDPRRRRPVPPAQQSPPRRRRRRRRYRLRIVRRRRAGSRRRFACRPSPLLLTDVPSRLIRARRSTTACRQDLPCVRPLRPPPLRPPLRRPQRPPEQQEACDAPSPPGPKVRSQRRRPPRRRRRAGPRSQYARARDQSAARGRLPLPAVGDVRPPRATQPPPGAAPPMMSKAVAPRQPPALVPAAPPPLSMDEIDDALDDFAAQEAPSRSSSRARRARTRLCAAWRASAARRKAMLWRRRRSSARSTTPPRGPARPAAGPPRWRGRAPETAGRRSLRRRRRRSARRERRRRQRVDREAEAVNHKGGGGAQSGGGGRSRGAAQLRRRRRRRRRAAPPSSRGGAPRRRRRAPSPAPRERRPAGAARAAPAPPPAADGAAHRQSGQ